jgi:hypothetical protein
LISNFRPEDPTEDRVHMVGVPIDTKDILDLRFIQERPNPRILSNPGEQVPLGLPHLHGMPLDNLISLLTGHPFLRESDE